MDLITAIINDGSRRRKAKAYLKEIGLGNFLAMPSFGTQGLLHSDHSFRYAIDAAFDDKFNILNKGKIVVVMNTSEIETHDIIDHIYDVINADKVDDKNAYNTGIIFSIPVKDIFKQVGSKEQ